MILVRVQPVVVMEDAIMMRDRSGDARAGLANITAMIAHPVTTMMTTIRDAIAMMFIGIIPTVLDRISMMNAEVIPAILGIITVVVIKFIKREIAMTRVVVIIGVLKIKILKENMLKPVTTTVTMASALKNVSVIQVLVAMDVIIKTKILLVTATERHSIVVPGEPPVGPIRA